MTELLLLMGKFLPEEKIIEDIKEAVTEYQITKSEESKKQLQMNCMLFLSKAATDGKEITDVMRDLKETERIKERLNSEKA